MFELLTAAWLLNAQTHAGCFTRKPNGNIVLHTCRNAPTRKRGSTRTAPHPQRKILVVPTGRSLDI